MENPWKELPTYPPYVIPDDSRAISIFNDRCKSQDHRIQTHILPEPYIGNIDSPIYLLSLNPGFDEKDALWHSDESFNSSLKSNLLHEEKPYPFYFINPEYEQAPGGQWWQRKLKWLISDTSMEIVANNVFCAEYFPYHSKYYKEMPKSIGTQHLISQRYTIFLIRQALRRNVKVVIMRSLKKWYKVIPELAGSENVYKLRNPQNVCISPNNLNEYDKIVGILRKC